MNICNFTGFLSEDPQLIEVIDGTKFILFELIVYNYRRTKTGEKTRTPTYISCEAWHTGAETIANLGKKGSKMTISASAKNVNGDIIFRVNEFDFGCLDGE